ARMEPAQAPVRGLDGGDVRAMAPVDAGEVAAEVDRAALEVGPQREHRVVGMRAPREQGARPRAERGQMAAPYAAARLPGPHDVGERAAHVDDAVRDDDRADAPVRAPALARRRPDEPGASNGRDERAEG